MKPQLPPKLIGEDLVLDLVPTREDDIFLVRSHLGFVLGEVLRLHQIKEGDATRIEGGDLSGLEEYVDIHTNENGDRAIFAKADLISRFSGQTIVQGVLEVREVATQPVVPDHCRGY